MKLLFILASLLVLMTPPLASAAPPSQEEINALLRTSEWYDNSPVEGCGAGVGADSATVEPGVNERAAFLYFVKRGLTPNQSAAIVGNLQAESGVSTTTVEKNPPPHVVRAGFGIAQWSDVRQKNGTVSTRRTDLEKFASSNGKDLVSLQYQLDYLFDQELVGSAYYKRLVYDPLVRTTTLREASDIFLHKFEAPGNATAQEASRAARGQKILELYGNEAGNAVPVVASSGAASSCAATPGGAIGFVGFPLKATKADMQKLNGSYMNDATKKMSRSGHPYAAYDIFAAPGTEILSIMDGLVVGKYEDKCGGNAVGIYNSAQDVVVSYLHMDNVSASGNVTAGQSIGTVGSRAAACGTEPHLHIDVAPGRLRPGCKREACPAANAAKFEQADAKINLGGGLYEGYTKLQ
ncbi:MAG TPA: phage tail tip lysozyme [Candidatus Saccharimonadales bacterium]|nr:phage tail tip lysozyme [Candidatus Saccharimonadales bacterium]